MLSKKQKQKNVKEENTKFKISQKGNGEIMGFLMGFILGGIFGVLVAAVLVAGSDRNDTTGNVEMGQGL
jgi:hypothetical protein